MTNYNRAFINTNKKVIQHILILSLVSISLLTNKTILANEVTSAQNTTRSTVSYESFSHKLTDAERLETIKIKESLATSDADTHKSTGLTRDVILNQKKSQKNKNGFSSLIESREFSTNFSIYNVTSGLYDDFDGDGYYQTFNIIFDADLYSYTNNDIAEVYALFYISEDGGPWTHYYTTDNFLIQGDNEDDKYEVITTFLEGYEPNHYDILIDLYQQGYGDIVASISSDDINELYALPLESDDYDQVYVEVIEVVHAGSLSIVSLFLLFSIISIRLFTRKA